MGFCSSNLPPSTNSNCLPFVHPLSPRLLLWMQKEGVTQYILLFRVAIQLADRLGQLRQLVEDGHRAQPAADFQSPDNRSPWRRRPHLPECRSGRWRSRRRRWSDARLRQPVRRESRCCPRAYDPPRPTCEHSMVCSPTLHPCPTCTRLSIFVSVPITVAPMLARSTHEFACTSTRSRQPGDAGLDDLVPSLGAVTGKPKAIGANDDSVLQHHVIAQVRSIRAPGRASGRRTCPRSSPRDRSQHAPAARHRRRSRRRRQSPRRVQCALLIQCVAAGSITAVG